MVWQPNSVWSPFQKELIPFGAIFKVLSVCHRPRGKPRMAACFVTRSDLKCFDTLLPISHTSVEKRLSFFQGRCVEADTRPGHVRSSSRIAGFW